MFYRDTKTGDAPRHWRWRGFITDYYTAEAPAALSTSSSSQSAGTPLSDADETNTLMQALPSGAASQFSDYAEEQQPDGNAHSSGQPLGSSETQASGSHSPDSADGQLSEGNANGTAQQPPGNGTKEDARSAEQQSSDRGAMQAFGNVEQQPSDSAAEGRQPRSDAPAFLLVHGFGAFGEQWRGQIKALTAAGYQVQSISCRSRFIVHASRQHIRIHATCFTAVDWDPWFTLFAAN